MNHPLTRIFRPIAMVVVIASIVVTTATSVPDVSRPISEAAVVSLSIDRAGTEQ